MKLTGYPLLLYKSTSLVVANLCVARNTIHGLEHAQRVTNRALNIYKTICEDRGICPDSQYVNYIILVGLLHDIGHVKYDPDGKLRKAANEYLNMIDPKNSPILKNIVMRLSFEYENNLRESKRRSDFVYALGIDGFIIRNIVSDADKLDALGSTGIHRIKEFLKNEYFIETNQMIPDDILKMKIKRTAEDKLFRINEFLYTIPGIKMGAILEEETKKLVDEL